MWSSLVPRQDQRPVQGGLVAAAGELRADAVRRAALRGGRAAGGVRHGVLLVLRQQAPEEGDGVLRPVRHHPRPQPLQGLQLHQVGSLRPLRPPGNRSLTVGRSWAVVGNHSVTCLLSSSQQIDADGICGSASALEYFQPGL